jgi:hypothetical protein
MIYQCHPKRIFLLKSSRIRISGLRKVKKDGLKLTKYNKTKFLRRRNISKHRATPCVVRNNQTENSLKGNKKYETLTGFIKFLGLYVPGRCPGLRYNSPVGE